MARSCTVLAQDRLTVALPLPSMRNSARDLRVAGGVLGPPALFDDIGDWRCPPHQGAGEQYLKRFGEAGLAAPVPADHQGQPWTWVTSSVAAGPMPRNPATVTERK